MIRVVMFVVVCLVTMEIDMYNDDGEWISPVFVRSAFNYDMDAVSRETGFASDEPTRTQQQFAEECDINTIVRNFGVTGELPNKFRIPLPAEFQDAVDYRDALEVLMKADDAFYQFPAEIRAKFQNDPHALVEFAADPANKEQMKQWGYLEPEKAPPAPLAVRVIADPTEPTKSA